jgi:MEMO1 family protein
MKPRCFGSFLAVWSLFLFLTGSSSSSFGGGIEDKGVREPVLAGTWYPANPEKLRGQITEFLSKADAEPGRDEVIGLVVPHAGYVYSGPVAAFGYKHLQGTNFKRVILIGPSHHVGFRGIAVDLQSAYRTPLGTTPVDKDFVNELLGTSSQMRWLPDAFTREHSLEIQVPFLQSVLKEFSIVPVLMQESDDVTCATLAEGLSKTIKKKQEKTLVLASTDLSHFHTGDQAKLLDHHFIEGLRAFDPKGLLRSMSRGECEACGGGPTVAALLTARDLGAGQAIVLRYANSGDVTGDYKRVVGYLSAAFVRKKE